MSKCKIRGEAIAAPSSLRPTQYPEEGTNVFVERLNSTTGLRLNGYIARVAVLQKSQNCRNMDECEQPEELESIE